MPRLDEIELPSGPVLQYVHITGIAAVCVVAESVTGRLRVVASCDPARARRGRARVVWLAWCQSEGLATQIADDAGNRSITKPEDTICAIKAAAAHLNVKLTESANVMRRLREAVDHVTRQLDEAQACGDLSWFNQAYRQWRIRANPTAYRCLIRRPEAGCERL